MLEVSTMEHLPLCYDTVLTCAPVTVTLATDGLFKMLCPFNDIKDYGSAVL